ncbi:unnamed protein product [Symbiodinium sp. CCMP2592]|nr:unnamed protein product [Symbiodinium sp. CCMP2592]
MAYCFSQACAITGLLALPVGAATETVTTAYSMEDGDGEGGEGPVRLETPSRRVKTLRDYRSQVLPPVQDLPTLRMALDLEWVLAWDVPEPRTPPASANDSADAEMAMDLDPEDDMVEVEIELEPEVLPPTRAEQPVPSPPLPSAQPDIIDLDHESNTVTLSASASTTTGPYTAIRAKSMPKAPTHSWKPRRVSDLMAQPVEPIMESDVDPSRLHRSLHARGSVGRLLRSKHSGQAKDESSTQVDRSSTTAVKSKNKPPAKEAHDAQDPMLTTVDAAVHPTTTETEREATAEPSSVVGGGDDEAGTVTPPEPSSPGTPSRMVELVHPTRQDGHLNFLQVGTITSRPAAGDGELSTWYLQHAGGEVPLPDLPSWVRTALENPPPDPAPPPPPPARSAARTCRSSIVGTSDTSADGIRTDGPA